MITRTSGVTHRGRSLLFLRESLSLRYACYLMPEGSGNPLTSGFLDGVRLSSDTQVRECVHLMQRSSSHVLKLVVISLLSAVAFIMQYLDFPLPAFPSFLKVDFSDVPALVAGFIFGPWIAVLVQLIKNGLHFIFTGSEAGIPIGEMTNFVAGSIFVVCTVLIARQISGLKGLLAGLLTGTLVMAAVLSVLNYYVILPAYAFLINWTVEGPEKTALVLYGIAPFNVIKGLLIAFVFLPLYVRLKPKLEQQFQMIR